jgi:divalent metal cation (Fe/Co/Zn/Cd) transporter
MSTPDLAVQRQARAPGTATASAEFVRAAKRVKQLSWLSLVWMGAEGAIAIVAGVMAGSIALIGFGIDSAIEGFASAIIVWRFTGARMLSSHAEERAQKLVAVQFFLLAPYIAFEALHALFTGERPDTSWLGIALTASSVIGMPLLGIAKVRLAEQLGSAATKGEGNQNLLCAYLAGAVLVGLLANTLVGAWWLDPVAALVIAGVAVREGLETWRGEGCCAPTISLEPQCEDDCRS